MRTRWLLLSLVAACSSGDPGDKDPGHWVPGKGDGSFDLVEAGPADGAGAIALDHRVPAYRIESFGGTKVAIDLKSPDADAYMIVEGPLENDGDSVAVGGGEVVSEDDDSGSGHDAHLDLTLDKPGVYRILAGTYDSLGLGEAAEGHLALSVTCSESCERGQIDQKTFVRALQSNPAFAAYAKSEIAALVHDDAMATQLSDQLTAILADPDLTGLDRFPTLPMAVISTIRPALGQIHSDPPKDDAVVTGDLAMLLGTCKADRSLPANLDAQLPGVRYGQFPSKTLSPCQFAHAGKLAQVLTSLAANNGSVVTFHGKNLTSPRELFGQLIATGHTIEVRNERMYANFLSMIVGDKDLIWPAWLDTGIQLSSGDSFNLPMGHSQYAWRISGPVVNTRVTFFLGIGGAGFFGQTDQRPAWSGTIASTDVTIASASDAGYADLLAIADTATTYLRRNHIERTTVAQGLPADGYGYVGVCNDSNAAIDFAVHGSTTAFPLLRAKELDAEADLGDGLDDTMRALPKDGDGITDARDALRRAVAMQPFPDGSPHMWDAVLGAQIATARRDVAH